MQHGRVRRSQIDTGAIPGADTTPNSGESFLASCFVVVLNLFLCRNDDYLAKASIPVDTSIIDRLLAEN